MRTPETRIQRKTNARLLEEARIFGRKSKRASPVFSFFRGLRLHSRDESNNYLYTVRTVLHVDPVVLVVPDALYSQVGRVVQGMTCPRERLNEEAFRHLTLARQNQHPAVDSQTVQLVRLGFFKFLVERSIWSFLWQIIKLPGTLCLYVFVQYCEKKTFNILSISPRTSTATQNHTITW